MSKSGFPGSLLAVLAGSIMTGCGGGGSTTPPVANVCLAGDLTGSGVGVALRPAFAALRFTSPVAAMQAPGDSSRWYVVEQGGTVRVFANDANVASSSLALDISGRISSGGETGLLGMAFSPDFPADPRVYLSYTAGSPSLQSRISEFRTRDGGASIDPGSEKVLLTVDQPSGNHKGGNLAFGPDGYLYAGFGDGGGSGDPWGAIGNGQLQTTLLGKMIRLDVDTGSPYGIPADNPYAGNPMCSTGTGAQGCPEIYAWGFRNPWRWSFDPTSGDLWVADVGQDAWEEVDRVVRGGNYGWRCREGAHPYNSQCGPALDLIDPVAEYDHGVGQSITGGFVYRGSAIAALAGRYVFGDFISGRMFSIPRDASPTLRVSGGVQSELSISSFAEGADGELLVVNYEGTLHNLVACP